MNAVAPGIIGTPMTEGLFDAKAIERLVPMNRMGLPEEVAGVVSFLSSEDAAYVTATDHLGERRHGLKRPAASSLLATRESNCRGTTHDAEDARCKLPCAWRLALCAPRRSPSPRRRAGDARRPRPAPPRSSPSGLQPSGPPVREHPGWRAPQLILVSAQLQEELPALTRRRSRA